MNAIENMHKVRLSNIYILSHIVYYILPLTIIIVLAIKAVGFSKVRQTLSIIFAMHYGFLSFQTKKFVTSIELISRFKYA